MRGVVKTWLTSEQRETKNRQQRERYRHRREVIKSALKETSEDILSFFWPGFTFASYVPEKRRDGIRRAVLSVYLDKLGTGAVAVLGACLLAAGCGSNGRAPAVASQVPLALEVPVSAKRVIVIPPVAPATLWLCWTTEFSCPIQWTVEQKANLTDEWSVTACWYEPGTEGGLLPGSNSVRFQVEASGQQRFFRVAGNYAPQ